MFDDFGRRESGIGAAQAFGDIRVSGGISVYMYFVDDRLIPRRAQQLVAAPGERLVDHDTFGYEAGVMTIVEREIGFWITDPVPEQRIRPVDIAGNCLRVRVDQDLGGVESKADFGLVQAVDTVAVQLSWPYLGEVHVPDENSAFFDPNTVRFLRPVRSPEETELHRRRIFREQREIHSLAVPRRSQGIGTPRPDSHRAMLSLSVVMFYKCPGQNSQGELAYNDTHVGGCNSRRLACDSAESYTSFV